MLMSNKIAPNDMSSTLHLTQSQVLNVSSPYFFPNKIQRKVLRIYFYFTSRQYIFSCFLANLFGNCYHKLDHLSQPILSEIISVHKKQICFNGNNETLTRMLRKPLLFSLLNANSIGN